MHRCANRRISKPDLTDGLLLRALVQIFHAVISANRNFNESGGRDGTSAKVDKSREINGEGGGLPVVRGKKKEEKEERKKMKYSNAPRWKKYFFPYLLVVE